MPFILREMRRHGNPVIFIYTKQSAVKRTVHIGTQRNAVANAVVMAYAEWHNMTSIYKAVAIP
ncbi:hypothetical protein SAMN05421740_10592 [Parapedobacter koreensis]|uniref:Uncharacterized protein n=1 Tax=Parapedobacter koreensis TaxID=332977 RepID=A0A1H7PZV3_9SPHI|nr:hypothetical protein SAMN05421740_10592 [Parapedobacter koreensis]